ncbi:hypothetical protein [Peterkaempfera sp. SMS 1(5)a]|uniref:hypothetical protein n=1 Tax=Peterkaempfera podocarpi TaxID=3232308 RepID=UPI00366E9D15
MTASTVLAADRLELGEGIRWTDDRAVLTDILTGRLLAAPTAAPAPTAQLPCPMGTVAPTTDSPGHRIAAADTGICRVDPTGGVETALGRPACPARLRTPPLQPYLRKSP